PGETVAGVEAEIEALLEALRAEDPALEIRSTIQFARDPFEADPGSMLVRAVEAAAHSVLGRAPERIGASYWMDAALCGAAGIDTVVIGPAGAGAHAAIEWVDLESCARLAAILTRAAVAYCGSSGSSPGRPEAPPR
ncbi:MAG TPA: M20/M25/M40 family metallo-hydrolase, partial [Gemmatimonadota bacterium]|nr:M20/M25/M40 family metallo-hydrolase [Gemmatimonadota bacterium]